MLKKLSAKWVLAFDGADHALIENGEVVFEGETIVRVGPSSGHPADDITDCGRALIAPGFVDLNALANIDTTLVGFSGQADRQAKAWSRAYAQTGRREVLTLAQRVTSARYTFSQLLLSGVTTALPVTSLRFRRWAESAEEFEAIAALAEELGLRLVLGPSYRSSINVVEADGTFGQYVDDDLGAEGLADAIAFVERCAKQGPLVSGLLVPSTIETCSDDLLRRTVAAAKDFSVPFRLHCCQSMLETQVMWRRTGKTSIGHLAALGVLGERALLPHALELGGPDHDERLIETDIAALCDSGATVVHCPLVIGREGRRLNSFAYFVKRGIRVGLGTDTAPPDMLMNLQIGLAMARSVGGLRVRLSDFFRASTTQPADAIGRRDLGRLEKGARADIVVWDLEALQAQPTFDPVESLFLAPPGGRARAVWVGGRQSVSNHAVLGADGAKAVAEIEAIAQCLLESFQERHWRKRPWRELFPAAFQQWCADNSAVQNVC